MNVRRLALLARVWLVLFLSSHAAEPTTPPANTKTARAWQREVPGLKREFDVSSPHPLNYFTDDPFLRDDGSDFCTDCTARGKSQVHQQHRFKTELSKVGETHQFAVYNLFYYFDQDIEAGKIDWKSILVRVPSGQFYEIYHLQAIGIEIGPAYFMDAGGIKILATSDLMGGTGFYSYESYWWFDKDGPVRINTDEAVSAALADILPAGSEIETGGGLDMENLTFKSAVWKTGDAHCCPTGGGVEIKFKLDKGLLAAIEKRFFPG